MLLNCGVGEDSWESLGLQGDPTSPSKGDQSWVHWKVWCWSWNSNTLASWCEELTDLKRPWCWERLKARGEGDDCGGPAWGTPPMAKVMRKEAWHMQRRDQASGNPLFLSIYPKTRVYFMLSFITVFLGEGVNVQLQGNKNFWAWQECFSLWTPLKVI